MRITHEWLGERDLPDAPNRVVSLAPNATKTVFLLGGGGRFIGQSSFCYRPDAAKQLPVVGNYTKARWELLERLRPDLILTTTGVQNPLTLELRRRAYAVLPVPLPHSPWGVLENAVLIGDLLGLDATPLVDGLSQRLVRLRGVGRGLRVYVEFDLGAPVTIGRASYLAAALRWMRTVNVYSPEPRAYFAPDLREVPNLIPDLIVHQPKAEAAIGGRGAAMLAERGWGAVPTYVTPGDCVAHFGPGLLDALGTLAALIDEQEQGLQGSTRHRAARIWIMVRQRGCAVDACSGAHRTTKALPASKPAFGCAVAFRLPATCPRPFGRAIRCPRSAADRRGQPGAVPQLPFHRPGRFCQGLAVSAKRPQVCWKNIRITLMANICNQ
ncbi:MAG: ABC transporter substrate-binding protein [Limnochordaceae bacterium]|nr:ABC transporter substrate-binding protein [Limnochordaceae bacterium]